MQHASNWTSIRAPAIARILLECSLDLYLLQEVDMQDLLLPELTKQYHVIAYPHPSREAGDAVVILAAKHRFVVQRQEMVPFLSKQNPHQNYMCAATALVKDKVTSLVYLVASTHFYKKKSHEPETTLMAYLQTHSNECNAVIWGGDCNDEYKNNKRSEYSCVAEGQNTRGAKRIDWIFYSGLEGWRSEATEAFVDATMKLLEPTGYPPSDHFGEAITLTPASLTMEKKAC
jgi:endonuclease/exonuclease/phosphatase family metal-dependent hydrolase